MPVTLVSGASEDETCATSPSATPIEIRPSRPAGRPPKRWRSSTARPLPIGAEPISSRSPAAAAPMPSRARLRAIHWRAAVTSPADRPLAITPSTAVSVCGVPKRFQVAFRPARDTSARWRADGASRPSRLSTSAGVACSPWMAGAAIAPPAASPSRPSTDTHTARHDRRMSLPCPPSTRQWSVLHRSANVTRYEPQRRRGGRRGVAGSAVPGVFTPACGVKSPGTGVPGAFSVQGTRTRQDRRRGRLLASPPQPWAPNRRATWVDARLTRLRGVS